MMMPGMQGMQGMPGMPPFPMMNPHLNPAASKPDPREAEKFLASLPQPLSLQVTPRTPAPSFAYLFPAPPCNFIPHAMPQIAF